MGTIGSAFSNTNDFDLSKAPGQFKLLKKSLLSGFSDPYSLTWPSLRLDDLEDIEKELKNILDRMDQIYTVPGFSQSFSLFPLYFVISYLYSFSKLPPSHLLFCSILILSSGTNHRAKGNRFIIQWWPSGYRQNHHEQTVSPVLYHILTHISLQI